MAKLYAENRTEIVKPWKGVIHQHRAKPYAKKWNDIIKPWRGEISLSSEIYSALAGLEYFSVHFFTGLCPVLGYYALSELRVLNS